MNQSYLQYTMKGLEEAEKILPRLHQTRFIVVDHSNKIQGIYSMVNLRLTGHDMKN